MAVLLKPVTGENYYACAALSTDESQKHMVPSAGFALSGFAPLHGMTPTAVYSGDTVVGLMMHGRDKRDGRYWLSAFLIDKKHQRRGYGKKALDLLIRGLKDKGVEALYLSYTPDNASAWRLYKSLGFVRTGESANGDFVAKLDLAPHTALVPLHLPS
ncbi:MAG: GNAT family N-acetyltransferase [Thermodesulfobacteriota bacterium]